MAPQKPREKQLQEAKSGWQGQIYHSPVKMTTTVSFGFDKWSTRVLSFRLYQC